ncbi:hypothetical protein EXS54_00640 [Patescibacteria group bacterium]|nr:hypothetical protein [Patescibacteria group bacterium]
MSEKETKPDSAKYNVSDTTLLSEVPSIGRGGIVRTREYLSEIVELPLVDACEELYDKNIKTVMSSACGADVSGGRRAYVRIDYDSLSLANREIADALDAKSSSHDGKRYVSFKMDVDEETTIRDVREWFGLLAGEFQQQPMNWVPRYTLEDLQKEYAGGTRAEFEGEGYHFDSAENIFYESEEHWRKTHEADS